MNWREAYEQAVSGERVRPVDLQPGAFIDYQFNGLRINFPGGSSSGYSLKDSDKEADWEIWEPPQPQGWAAYPDPPAPEPVKRRRGRQAREVPTEINDIGWQPANQPRPASEGWPVKPAEPQGWPSMKQDNGG